VIPWSADEAGSSHQQPVADGVAGRLIAGDLGFAVLSAIDLVATGRNLRLGRLSATRSQRARPQPSVRSLLYGPARDWPFLLAPPCLSRA